MIGRLQHRRRLRGWGGDAGDQGQSPAALPAADLALCEPVSDFEPIEFADRTGDDRRGDQPTVSVALPVKFAPSGVEVEIPPAAGHLDLAGRHERPLERSRGSFLRQPRTSGHQRCGCDRQPLGRLRQLALAGRRSLGEPMALCAAVKPIRPPTGPLRRLQDPLGEAKRLSTANSGLEGRQLLPGVLDALPASGDGARASNELPAEGIDLKRTASSVVGLIILRNGV